MAGKQEWSFPPRSGNTGGWVSSSCPSSSSPGENGNDAGRKSEGSGQGPARPRSPAWRSGKTVRQMRTAERQTPKDSRRGLGSEAKPDRVTVRTLEAWGRFPFPLPFPGYTEPWPQGRSAAGENLWRIETSRLYEVKHVSPSSVQIPVRAHFSSRAVTAAPQGIEKFCGRCRRTPGTPPNGGEAKTE